MAKVSQITVPYGTTYDIGASTQNITLRDYENGTSDVAMFPVVDRVRANRLAFLPADQIIIEKTTDGGTTWESAGIQDSEKAALFGPTQASINIPLLDGKKSELCGIRITITGMKYNVPSGTSETNKYDYWNSTYINKQERYFQLERLWFWISANSDEISLKVEAATGANPNNWSVRFNKDWGMTGWSGSDWAKVSSGTFGGGRTQTGNYWNWRLTFFSRKKNGDAAFRSNTVQVIQNIRGYGASVWGIPNKLMYHDHLYDIDVNQNAAFPAKVTATGGFVGDLTGDASTVNGHTVQANVPSNAKFTDTTYTFANGTNGFTVTPSGGTAQTVTVTPSISDNITGSGTAGYLAKFDGTHLITSGPQLGSSTTTFLRNDGAWATPSNNAVTQTASSTNADYEILFSVTADNTTRTEGARKSSNLKFNPSTGNLQSTLINGCTIESNVTLATSAEINELLSEVFV